jgi:hypothetical protein
MFQPGLRALAASCLARDAIMSSSVRETSATKDQKNCVFVSMIEGSSSPGGHVACCAHCAHTVIALQQLL